MKKKERILVDTDEMEGLEFASVLGFTEVKDSHETSSEQIVLNLPDGWKTQKGEGTVMRRFIDSQGNERGLYCNGRILFCTRFELIGKSNPDSSVGGEILTFFDKKKGQVVLDFGHFEPYDIYGHHLDLVNFAKNVLNKTYPGWEDPTKYWED